MKLLFSIPLLAGLASCSKNEPAPLPTLTGDAWHFQSELVVATLKDGTPPTTTNMPFMTGPVTLTYSDATHFTLDIQATVGSTGHHMNGTYTYQGQILTHPYFYSWNTDRIVPKTVQVTTLSTHTLVTTERWESLDAQTAYVTTLTYTR